MLGESVFDLEVFVGVDVVVVFGGVSVGCLLWIRCYCCELIDLRI